MAVTLYVEAKSESEAYLQNLGSEGGAFKNFSGWQLPAGEPRLYTCVSYLLHLWDSEI